MIPASIIDYPNLARVVGEVLARWPEHAAFLSKRFSDPNDPTLKHSEENAGLVLLIMSNDVAAYCAGYRWLCQAMIDEDLFFRRHGRYRLNRFADAVETVYARPDIMEPYMKGLLLSQLLWANHARASMFFTERFLARLLPSADYLEIGPGHGLGLHMASKALPDGTLTGWDASESSIAMTRRTLAIVKSAKSCRLEMVDVLASPSPGGAFDAVVASEVLEHLERPDTLLKIVRGLLRKGGIAFFNTPVNSAAPDHIYLWRTPEEIEDLVRSAGFTIIDSAAIPATGYDLERARRRRVTISSLIIAQCD